MAMNSNLIAGVLIGMLVGVGGGYAIFGESEGSAPMMHGAMDTMTAGLAGKTGDAFDHAFLNEMIVHHEGAIAMAEMVLQHSQRQELRQLAENIIAAQSAEISQMRAWMAEWFAVGE